MSHFNGNQPEMLEYTLSNTLIYFKYTKNKVSSRVFQE